LLQGWLPFAPYVRNQAHADGTHRDRQAWEYFRRLGTSPGQVDRFWPGLPNQRVSQGSTTTRPTLAPVWKL